MAISVHDGEAIAAERDDQLTSSEPGADPGVISPARKARTQRQREDKPSWSFGTSLATRIVSVLVVGLMLAGPAALVTVLLRPAATSASEDEIRSIAAGRARSSVVAESTAESLVWSWSTATRDDIVQLGQLVAGGLDESVVQLPTKRPPMPARVAATVATSDPDQPAVWRVHVQLVGADNQVQLLDVPVLVNDGRAIALSLPAPIAVTSDRLDDGRQIPVGIDQDQEAAGQTAAQFMTALLTGQDVSRWSTPGSAVAPITPPIASGQVTVKAVQIITEGEAPAVPADDQRIQVQVTAAYVPAAAASRKTPAVEATTSAQYQLDLQGRGGRWEVLSYSTPQPK